MPCLRSRSSACRRACRSDEVSRNGRLAPGRVARANVGDQRPKTSLSCSGGGRCCRLWCRGRYHLVVFVAAALTPAAMRRSASVERDFRRRLPLHHLQASRAPTLRVGLTGCAGGTLFPLRALPRMPRYFFHVHHERPSYDQQGEEFADRQAAWHDAVVSTGRSLVDLWGAGSNRDGPGG
jgi:hypothetical protein